ncbi:sperm microtubule associated protein 2-like isoform X2 [Oscarella lobularis]|uniref:sperm microtubule associated protein 2-like isoform X2 n=1 Tax=Oscarella lobularis TaxID=121494 RepID=UPI003313BEF1
MSTQRRTRSLSYDASQTRRIDELAASKSIPSNFLEDRRSVYWDWNVPTYTGKTTEFVLTPRQETLYYSKRLHPHYLENRPSPMWPVSSAALQGTCPQRIERLSQAKEGHPLYEPPKEVETVVSDRAKRAICSARVRTLAQPKHTYQRDAETPSRNLGSSQSRRGDAEPSNRILLLSQHKRCHSSYEPCREVKWDVSRGAMSAMATDRIQKLSRPREGGRDNYNPNAWTVSRAALTAHASPRIGELAAPLPRKTRTKKTLATTA